MHLIFNKMVVFGMHAIAKLNIADHVSDTPVPVEEVAMRTNTHAPSLYRVLRSLTVVGVFAEASPRHFVHTPVSSLLRSDHPHSLRDMAIMFVDEWQTRAFVRMEDVIRTGTNGVILAYGKQAFDLFREIPDQAANFHRAMTSFSRTTGEVIAETIDLSSFKQFADVGGGHGLVLGKFLARFPQMRGVLFDLPEVVAGAPGAGHLSPFEKRVSIEGGSFLDKVPAGCDAYGLKHILHDWDDASCQRILSQMRAELVKAAPQTGRVFIFEMVVPESPAPAPAKLLDIEMLVCTPGGKERTETEFRHLLADSGLKLTGIKPTKTPICIIEAAVA
jgi:hypothetical protein